MPRGQQLTDASPFGKVLMSWEYQPREQYQRGFLWYVAMIAAMVLLLLYAVISANFLFALIILMFALIIYLSTLFPLERRKCMITETGILCGDSFYPYRSIRRFWLVYQPPQVKKLYFNFRDTFSPRVSVSLEKTDPNRLRDLLSKYAVEDFDQDMEPFSDTVARLLKI